MTSEAQQDQKETRPVRLFSELPSSAPSFLRQLDNDLYSTISQRRRQLGGNIRAELLRDTKSVSDGIMPQYRSGCNCSKPPIHTGRRLLSFGCIVGAECLVPRLSAKRDPIVLEHERPFLHQDSPDTT
jgi:hypothetical protein